MPSFKQSCLAATFLSLHALGAQAATQLTKITSSLITPEASAELKQICPSGMGFPGAWTWLGRAHTSPIPASQGQPKIEQYRAGQLIATYSSFSDQPNCQYYGDGTDYQHPATSAVTGCGPFTRSHAFRLWAPGDVFLVYPAVYAGPYNNPWIGPETDGNASYAAGIFNTPDNILVQGVVQNNTRPVILLDGGSSDNTLGQAPVYFERSNGFHMDNIDVRGGARGSAGKAAVYESAASNLTLSNMRVFDFAHIGVNGLFGAGQYSGTLTLDHMEIDHNGGTNGPAHNAYIGASAVDPNFTVVMQHSWSHDAYYGHLFKSRAQHNVFTANYFQGGLPIFARSQAETYLLDIPNGGTLVARDNVFVKNASGVNSNGMSLTFGMEGFTDARVQSLDVENNTFVTFTKYFDGSHQNYPLSFLYPNVTPDNAAWPAGIAARVIKNAFVGYCPQGPGTPMNYRGELALTESFGELSQTYAFATKVTADDTWLASILPGYAPVLGAPAYTQKYDAQPTRQAMTLGAED